MITKKYIIEKATSLLNQNSLVKSCSLFGSYATGKASENSDIDFLLELEPSASLFDRATLQLDLEKLFQIKIDVVSSTMLHPYIEPPRKGYLTLFIRLRVACSVPRAKATPPAISISKHHWSYIAINAL